MEIFFCIALFLTQVFDYSWVVKFTPVRAVINRKAVLEMRFNILSHYADLAYLLGA